MALSWNERTDEIGVLHEGLENERDRQAQIACRFCDQIFCDNNSLLTHFQSHFHQDGAFNGRLQVGSSMPPGNSSNSNSINTRDHGARELTNLSLGNSRFPSFSQLSAPSLTDHTFVSQPNWTSNFNSRFASQPVGPLDLRSPIGPTSADIFTSEASTRLRSTFHFPTAPGTTGLSHRTRRFLPQTARRNEVEGPFFDYTKPYINQLDRPIRKTIVLCDDDVGGNNFPDQIDLTLKL